MAVKNSKKSLGFSLNWNTEVFEVIDQNFPIRPSKLKMTDKIWQ